MICVLNKTHTIHCVGRRWSFGLTATCFDHTWYLSGRANIPNEFNVHGSVHRNNILVYNSNKMHKSQNLFNLTTALHVSGVTITHLQEHKTTVTTASGNRYTVLLSAAIVEEL